VQAKRDTESSIINKFWIPACAGMTTLKVFFDIVSQSQGAGGGKSFACRYGHLAGSQAAFASCDNINRFCKVFAEGAGQF
jgi:hypothetical protein